MTGQNLASPRPSPPRLGDELHRQEFHRLLARTAAELGRGSARVKVPEAQGVMQRRAGMHYHFRPEVFVQVEGATSFRFPDGAMMLLPTEVAVIPSGLPHVETALKADGGEGPPGTAFRNLVIGFDGNSVSMHLGRDAGEGRPEIEAINFFSTPDLRRLVELVEFLARAAQSGGPEREATVRGLALGLFASLAGLARAETPEPGGESRRIFQIKWLVRDQLQNPALKVSFIAQRLHCSADYLSHLFHKETGETLIHYIHRRRLSGAVEALDNPALTISEIAWACGFADAGYFTRVFRKHFGVTPQAYRKGLNDAAGGGGEARGSPPVGEARDIPGQKGGEDVLGAALTGEARAGLVAACDRVA